jgi:DNA-binding response OmpR family regulator
MNSSSTQNIQQPQSKVLIISDEPVNAKIWGYSLNQLGLDVWFEKSPDLIIIEDFNDQVEEIELCKQLRAETIVPILYLTSKTDEHFQLEVYRIGADDCIPFPITPRIFQAKVKAWLHRTMIVPFSILNEVNIGGFRLIADQKQLSLPNGDIVKLTNLEARLMFLMMNHPNHSFKEKELIQKVWGGVYVSDSRLLKNHIYRLRRKIEPDPAHPFYLVNVGHNEYKFQTRET